MTKNMMAMPTPQDIQILVFGSLAGTEIGGEW
jgi:hypothetical protein